MVKKLNQLITYILRITKECKEELEFDEVYDRINNMLNQIDNKDGLLFPLVCWIDEMILLGCWNGKEKWINNMLQVKYFSTNNGGELFFKKLEIDDNKKYYILMLKLGFKGKYFENQQMIDSILKKYLKKEKIKKLFPFAYMKMPMKQRKLISNIYNYKTVIFFIIILIIIYGVYYFNLEVLIKSKGLL